MCCTLVFNLLWKVRMLFLKSLHNFYPFCLEYELFTLPFHHQRKLYYLTVLSHPPYSYADQVFFFHLLSAIAIAFWLVCCAKAYLANQSYVAQQNHMFLFDLYKNKFFHRNLHIPRTCVVHVGACSQASPAKQPKSGRKRLYTCSWEYQTVCRVLIWMLIWYLAFPLPRDMFLTSSPLCSLSHMPYFKTSRNVGNSEGSSSLPVPIRLLICVNLPSLVFLLEAIVG